MVRFKYYNYFGNTSKYDAALDINHYDWYNETISNRRNHINSNEIKYEFDLKDLDFNVNDLNDRLLQCR